MIADFKHAECIFAVDNRLIEVLDIVEGFDTWSSLFASFINLAEREFILSPRKELEKNEQYRQLLPYSLLVHRDEEGVSRYGVYRRCKGVGESRLLGKASIGFGGHVDLYDTVTYPEHPSVVNLEETLLAAVDRELDEEVDFPDGCLTSREYKGILIDNSDSVGRVHVGLVYRVEVDKPIDGLKEKELEWVGMFTAEELETLDLDFENWSKILIKSGKLI